MRNFFFAFYCVPAQLTTDPCSFFSCCQQETQAKALITLERSYFADLFALLRKIFRGQNIDHLND